MEVLALQDKDVARERENGTGLARVASIVGGGSQHDGVVFIAGSLRDVDATVGDIAKAVLISHDRLRFWLLSSL